MITVFIILLFASSKAQDSLYSYPDGSIVDSENECYSKTPTLKNRKSCVYEITTDEGKSLACYSIQPGDEEKYDEIKKVSDYSFSDITLKGCNEEVSKYNICGYIDDKVDTNNNCKNTIVDYRDEEVERKGGKGCCYMKDDDEEFCGWGKETLELTKEFYKDDKGLEIIYCWNNVYINKEGKLIEENTDIIYDDSSNNGLMIKSAKNNLFFLILIIILI